MLIKIFSIPFIAYFATLFSVASLGTKRTQQVFGDNVIELWLMWIVILLVSFVLHYFIKKRLTKDN